MSKSYNYTVNGQIVMIKHLEIGMVRGHKRVDEDGEFSMSEEWECVGRVGMCMWRDRNIV